MSQRRLGAPQSPEGELENASARASNIVASADIGTYRLVRERSMDCEVKRHWLGRSEADARSRDSGA
jgi:hypothetical protein